MLKKYCDKLELNKVLKFINSYCITEIGKELLENLNPSNDILIVQHLQQETTQALKLILESGNPPFLELSNNKKLLKSIEIQEHLSCSNLLQVEKILKTSSNLKKYFNDVENKNIYNCLENYFSILYTNPDLQNKIKKSIIDENTVADEASPTLQNIRRKKRALESSIKETLNKLIHSSSYSKYIMEPIITIRNDRFVIPIKVEYQNEIKGFVHDISYSGSTVFVEPISIFETNNQIHNLQFEENIEVEKILHSLSEAVFPIILNLKLSLESIGNLDLIFAKAKYSISTNSIEPIINEEKYINLIEAKHPLIDTSIVVPIDIEIGKNFTSLIITGPNTGGKTVALKTTGLLCLMAYCGLHIPANESSSINVFDNIFADIGDEQSIQESLSTFSSHMLNIIEINKLATNKSLILVDELGSGTDPLQGANLAISILEHFHHLGALSITTTHYQEIKQYALVTEGFENASSEFDIENLKPTYKLLIGVPGKSNAFAITKKLGMDEKILKRAEDLMKSDDTNIEELIKTIYNDKIELENEKEKIKQNSNQIELLRKSLEIRNKELLQKENEIIEKAKINAREILLNAKKNANNLISELNELHSNSSNDSLKQANSIRNKLNENIQNISKQSEIETIKSNLNKEDIKIGMTVFIKSLNSEGLILSLPNKSNDVQVQIGSMKMTIKLNNLDFISPKNNLNNTNINNKKTNNSDHTSFNISSRNLKSKTATTEINVIGQNIDEAVFLIDKFLDDAILAKLQSVRIVHGKGTGKLRSGIHTFLKKHPHVKSYRLGTFGEGEMGVTIVELN